MVYVAYLSEERLLGYGWIDLSFSFVYVLNVFKSCFLLCSWLTCWQKKKNPRAKNEADAGRHFESRHHAQDKMGQRISYHLSNLMWQNRASDWTPLGLDLTQGLGVRSDVII